MEPINFFDRIKSLFEIILSSPFFVFVLLISFLTLILLIINVKTKKKIIKIITASIYGIIIVLMFIKYGQSLLNLGDVVVDRVFTAIYFPNYISYICMIILSVLLVLTVFINKKVSSFGKYSSIISFSFMLFLFVLTLETIISNNIDITNKASVYASNTLVILIQSSTIIFALWVLIYLISLIVNKLDSDEVAIIENNRKKSDVFDKLRIENIKDVEDPVLMKTMEFNLAFEKYKDKSKLKLKKLIEEKK